MRDIQKGEDAQIAAIAAVIAAVDADVLLLTDFDYDQRGVALAAFAATLADTGAGYPFHFAARPNSGMASGLDLDGNGRLGEARDAMGYGRFAGDGGLAVLSRFPVDTAKVRDFSDLLWRDVPQAELPVVDGTPFPSAAAQAVQRLSSTAHWIVPIDAPDGPVSLLAFAATPPVFDGPEDLNGLRNRDELRLWEQVLDGQVGPAPEGQFVVLGNANLDPADGDGNRGAMADFLARPDIQDPRPASKGGVVAADADHAGDPALDTVDWPDGAPGNLRVSYVLPSRDWQIAGAGVFWPAPDDSLAALLGSDGLAAGPHRLVWVDIVR